MAAAEVNRSIILRHRDDIALARCLAMKMLAEAGEATRSPEQLRDYAVAGIAAIEYT